MIEKNTTTPSNLEISKAIKKAEIKGKVFAGMRIMGMVLLGLGINDLIDQNTKNAEDIALIAEYTQECTQDTEPQPQCQELYSEINSLIDSDITYNQWTDKMVLAGSALVSVSYFGHLGQRDEAIKMIQSRLASGQQTT